MFFSSRKREKLLEKALSKVQAINQAQEQARLNHKREVALQETNAYQENVQTFYRICDMVRSLPKKRQIVVVQRKNIFKGNHDRNSCYLKLAKQMRHEYLYNGKAWISDNYNCLYAFYAPTKIDSKFRQALEEFSKGGHRIQRIRYYYFNY